jgi:hypothetical protein
MIVGKTIIGNVMCSTVRHIFVNLGAVNKKQGKHCGKESALYDVSFLSWRSCER